VGFVIGLFIGAALASAVLVWWFSMHYDFDRDREESED
jgi:glycerol uptake facilitator-like aquaporin